VHFPVFESLGHFASSRNQVNDIVAYCHIPNIIKIKVIKDIIDRGILWAKFWIYDRPLFYLMVYLHNLEFPIRNSCFWDKNCY